MDVGTVVLIAVIAWVSLLVIVVALCRGAGRADAQSDRHYAAFRAGRADAPSDRHYAALR